jgi:diguanylate cyclase (GGDEF)-like protein/PAS domain S-box-containing protein
MARHSGFDPFARSSRWTIIGIVLTFGLVSAIGTTLSIRETGGSRNRATVVEVAARQRTLAERYVGEVLLARAGQPTDPRRTASLLAASAEALLDGGTAPAVNGDDDATTVGHETNSHVRSQLEQGKRLVADLTATGSAMLAHRPVAAVRLTAGEHIQAMSPLMRLRILAALTSNVSLDAARTIAAQSDGNISDLIWLEAGLGAAGLLVSLLLAAGLIAATRRQTAQFQSLVTYSTDLVFVLEAGGRCRYVSQSVASALERSGDGLKGNGLLRFVHEDDRDALATADDDPRRQQIVFRMQNASGEWRHLEAHLADLRHDRYVRGVVLNARDVTERVRLEQELTQNAQRDNFGNRLTEALEMADDEAAAYEVVERAMSEVATATPMELLLSDSSRAHLKVVASSDAGAPGCPVEPPFSCVAVRRGNPVVFESSEALNACPKLRDPAGGPCSAVCVPMTFMGRALGVLHATGTHGEPLDPEQVAQLTTLATQAGTRIGTVRAFERTQLQASTDSLTGLTNRRVLEDTLRGLVRTGRPFALAFADLDHFKQLNDTHGHETGDRSLRIFAQVVQHVLREDDLVGRWGGEEFVIVTPGLDRHEAVTVLERIRTALADVHSGGLPPFTASFDVTDSSQGETLEELVQLADSALYEAKQAGRDRIGIGEAEPVSLPREPAKIRRKRGPALQEVARDDEAPADGAELR